MRKYKKIFIGLILGLMCAILPFVGVAEVRADDTIQINTIYEEPVILYFNVFTEIDLLNYEFEETNDGVEATTIAEIGVVENSVYFFYTLKLVRFSLQNVYGLAIVNEDETDFNLLFVDYQNENIKCWNPDLLDLTNGEFIVSPLILRFRLLKNFEWISFEPFPKVEKTSIFNTIISKITSYLTGLFSAIGLTFSIAISIFYNNNSLTFLGEIIAWGVAISLVAVAVFVVYRLIKNSASKLASGVKVNKDD